MRYLKTAIITLVFAFTHTAMAGTAQPRAGIENTMRGIVVKLDMKEGAGTLKQEYTNKLVSFRFAKELTEKRIDLPKVGTVVEFTYILNDDNIAASE